MKKTISLLLTLTLILTVCLLFSGCDQPKVRVTSTMNTDLEFRGSRTITVAYPLSADIDAIKNEIIDTSPADEVYGAEFRYVGVEEDGYYFELTLAFGDQEEYEQEVSGIIGREANTMLSQKNTALTQGTRMSEDFDVSELIGWVVRTTAADSATADLTFVYDRNIVNIGAETFTTGSTIAINNCDDKSCVINSIEIKTYNKKDGKYDRTFSFSIPNQTYLTSEDKIKAYFTPADDSGTTDWSVEGSNMIYSVMYKDLSLDELKLYTSLTLDTDDVDIFYGDKDNSSTPLSEGLAFEERVDTFSFVGPDKGAPTLIYTYSLPTNTIHGDGTVFMNGKWTASGAWEDGAYQLKSDEGITRLRVPDGIQYSINGIDFRLESLGKGQFRRTTSFLYNKTDGYDGMKYAANYFEKKGASVTTSEDDNNLICCVVCEGDTSAITTQLVQLFGSGNFIAYQKSTGAFSLSTKTHLTDYVNLGYMLNSSNANRPMTYYITSNGEENIVSVSIDGAETAYSTSEETSITIVGGCATVEYRGNIPIAGNIAIYIAIGSALLLITIAVVYLMLRRRKPKMSKRAQEIVDEVVGEEEEPEDSRPFAPMQTTTFSIFELGALSRNKKYVDEINEDIEKRLEADRLEELKKELRLKELEEMEKKVYGAEEGSSEEPQPEEIQEEFPEDDDDAPADRI